MFERALEPLLRALQEDPLTAPLSRARMFALVAEAAAGASLNFDHQFDHHFDHHAPFRCSASERRGSNLKGFTIFT